MKKYLLFFLITILSGYLDLEAFEWALYGVEGREFSNGLSVSSSTEEHKSGYVDASGKLVIPYKFKSANNFIGNNAEVETENGHGIINKKGEYILEPGDYFIMNLENIPSASYIKDNKTGKSALFDGERLITDFIYDYVSDYNAPFVTMSIHEPLKTVNYNTVSQEMLEDGTILRQGEYMVFYGKNKEPRVFDKYGEPVKGKNFKKSSKGIEIFKDNTTGKIGLRNANTGEIVQTPKYKFNKMNYEPIWVADVITLYDSISPEENLNSVIFDANGNKIVSSDKDTGISILEDHIYLSSKDYRDNSRNKYFDFQGNYLPELDTLSIYKVFGEFYNDGNNKRIYNVKTRKFIDDAQYPSVSEGMMKYKDSSDKYYFYNIENSKKIGPYKYVNPFNEGVAVVTKENDKTIIIDKQGKEYTFPEGIEIWGKRVSEGVIFAYDEPKSVFGFIYNPIGHDGWHYSQKGGQIDDYAYEKLVKDANNLFEQERYGTAMNKYYQLMMLRPEKSTNFNNYAACLFNLGDYDEALTAIEVSLQYWPKNEFAINLRNKIINVLNSQDDYEEYEEPQQKSSVWDAIGNFANALSQTFGTYNAGVAYIPSYNSNNSFSSGGSTAGNYESQYRNWERRAEQNYNSLTNLGYSSTSSSGNKRGGSGGKVSSGNYVQMKRNLREAQNQMRSIRRKAAQVGVNIPQSKWETASVSY